MLLGAPLAPLGCLGRPPHAPPPATKLLHTHRASSWRRPSLRSSNQPKQPNVQPNVAAQAARGVQLDLAKNPKVPAPWQLVVFLSAGAMLTCNLHRSVFTMLLPDLTSHHLLTLRDVGVMNSAMLGGYLAGQIPAGFLSDMLGGERVLLVGLLLWSLSLATTGLMPNQLGLIVSRVAMGLFSACAMPATSAMAAKWVPPHIKASTLATIYMLFNMGGVLGLIATPFIGQVCGFTSTFMAFGLAGALWAVAGWLCLPSEKARARASEARTTETQGVLLRGVDEEGDVAVEGEGFGGVYHHVDAPGSVGNSSSSSSSSSSSRRSGNGVQSSGSMGSSGSGSRAISSSSSSSAGGDGDEVSGSAHRVGSNSGTSTSSSSYSNGSNGSNGAGYGMSEDGGWSGNGNGNGNASRSGSANGNGNGSSIYNSSGSGGNGSGSSLPYGGGVGSGAGGSQTMTMASVGKRGGSQAVAERPVEKMEMEQELAPPPTPSPAPQQQQMQQQPQQQQPQQQETSQQPAEQGQQQHPPLLAQISVLCWAHGVMGFGFFIFQSWIPMYLASLGLSSPTSTGLLAGMPWLAAGLVGAVAGNLADTCIRKGIPRLTVRRGAHTISTLGCALCAVPLALGWATTPTAATGWLVLFQSCYAFSFGGFHAYVQDVAQASAGKLLGLTNSCSIALGIVGNLCTGVLVESTGSYSAVFLVTIGLYLTSLAAFFAFLRGTPLEFA